MSWAACGGRRGPWLLAAMTFLVPAPSKAQLDLELLPLTVAEGGRVEFYPSFQDPVSSLPEALGVGCQRTDSFRVCPDLGSVAPNPSLTAFVYEIYVQPRTSSNTDRGVRFRFSAKPFGQFLDHEAEVDFDLSDGSTTESGTLVLPVHSIGSEAFLGFRLEQVPVQVPSGGEHLIFVDLINRLNDLDVLVGRELRVTSGRPELWQGDLVATIEPQLPQGEELRLPRGFEAARKIRIRVTPTVAKAILRSSIPYRRGATKAQPGGDAAAGGVRSGIHDRITVSVPYRTAGGFPRELSIEIPVRFWPSGWALIGMLLLGVVIGSFLRWIRVERRGRRGWWRRTLAATVIAAVAWIVALLLVNLDSELRLLSLDFDPNQLLPVFLLGFLCGLAGGKGAAFLQMIPGLNDLFAETDEKGGQEEEAGEEEPESPPNARVRSEKAREEESAAGSVSESSRGTKQPRKQEAGKRRSGRGRARTAEAKGKKAPKEADAGTPGDPSSEAREEGQDELR
ncbi:MAG: hypothetical protein KDD47_18115 [Acidobacteria bacterium]|nr:hypothetical protein [Acidobacteriota bacterium]